MNMRKILAVISLFVCIGCIDKDYVPDETEHHISQAELRTTFRVAHIAVVLQHLDPRITSFYMMSNGMEQIVLEIANEKDVADVKSKAEKKLKDIPNAWDVEIVVKVGYDIT